MLVNTFEARFRNRIQKGNLYLLDVPRTEDTSDYSNETYSSDSDEETGSEDSDCDF